MSTTEAGTSISGWNFTLEACLRHERNVNVLASVLAVPAATISDWVGRRALPTPRAVRAMKRYLAERDAPKYPRTGSSAVKVRGSRGEVGAKKKAEKPAYKLRRAERPRYGWPKALFGPIRRYRQRKETDHG